MSWFCPYCAREHFSQHEPCCGEAGHLVTGFENYYTHCGRTWANRGVAPDESDRCPDCGTWVSPNYSQEIT